MTIAKIIDGEVVEYRDISLEDVPLHKRFLWLPVEVEGSGDHVEIVLESDRVVTKRTAVIKVPPAISDRQFFQMLARLSVITSEEALAAVGPGTIPGAMETMIQSLPEVDQFPARMLLTGATQFERNHPMVAVLGAGLGWTSEQIDNLWIEASAL